MVSNFIRKENREFFNNNLSKTVGVLLLVVVLLFILADFKIYQKKKELASQVAIYKQKIEDIKKSNQTLKDEIANSDNVDYLEKIAYEQLGQQKPGEKQIIFIAPEEEQIVVDQQESYWGKGSWFGGLGRAWQWIKTRF